MSSPQLENGFTRVANEWLDIFCCTQLSDREWRIIHAIIRKTYGYGKKDDSISYSQLEKMTGINRRHLPTLIKKLETKELIKTDKSNYITGYTLNKVSPEWGTPQIGNESVPQTGNGSVPQMGEYKRKKEIKENTVPNGTASILIAEETMQYEELTYEPLEGSKKKSVLGRKTMFILARAYLDAKGIKLNGEPYDANKIAKGLSKLYNECKKDPDETIRRIQLGAEYFKSKELDWTPEAVWRRWEDIKLWKGDKPIYERRKL